MTWRGLAGTVFSTVKRAATAARGIVVTAAAATRPGIRFWPQAWRPD